MRARQEFSRIYKLTLAVVIAGLTLAILTYQVVAKTEGCSLPYNFLYAAFLILRLAMLAVWQAVPAYFCGDSTYSQHLPQVVASLWPLAGILAG
jgi:hypothetical protein